MKKFFAFVMAITMVMSVMVMGPKEAFAKEETISEDSFAAPFDDAALAARVMDKVEWFVENHPDYDEKVVKMMISRDGDEVVVSAAYLCDGEMYYDTYRFDHYDLLQLDAATSIVVAKAHLGIWES